MLLFDLSVFFIDDLHCVFVLGRRRSLLRIASVKSPAVGTVNVALTGASRIAPATLAAWRVTFRLLMKTNRIR